MNKIIKIILVVIVALGLIVGGYFIFKKYLPFWEGESPESKAIDEASRAAELLGEKASQGTIPDITSKNPLEEKPDINPVDKTNPFKDLKTNPFE